VNNKKRECVLCGNPTKNTGVFIPKTKEFQRDAYIYSLCLACHQSITDEKYQKIEDAIWKAETNNGKPDA
jgi:hypothetical protein